MRAGVQEGPSEWVRGALCVYGWWEDCLCARVHVHVCTCLCVRAHMLLLPSA